MTDSLKIAKLTEEFVTSAAALESECLKTAWSEKSIGECIGNSSIRYLVATIGKELAGTCSFCLVFGEGQLINLAVGKNFRRHKIGSGLLEAAINEAIGENAEIFVLEVEPDNDAAISLYSSFGFEVSGRRKSFYPDGSDALCMIKKLDSQYGKVKESE